MTNKNVPPPLAERKQCEFYGCHEPATHQMTLTISDSGNPPSLHVYCKYHAFVAENNVFLAAYVSNRQDQVSASVASLTVLDQPGTGSESVESLPTSAGVEGDVSEEGGDFFSAAAFKELVLEKVISEPEREQESIPSGESPPHSAERKEDV